MREGLKSVVPDSCDVTIHEASPCEIPKLRELVVSAINLNPTNPYLASFRHEMSVGPSPEERFVEYAVLVNGELGARCQINFQPQADDIDAYGPGASELYANQRIATLTGDLVAPAFRGLGLQTKMMQYRLRLLASLNFTYAMCGILVGNDVSRDNYCRLGFKSIGEKEIDWGESAVGERIKRVVLYGLHLSDLEVTMPRN
jgi:ribosomal protein S18 acetylase RimI-like enzyme